jgi:DNA-directed RNA polymerase specialized sigma24 family protein
MASMAAGNPAALGQFLDEHRTTLATVMRSHLISMGWVHPPPDVIHDLVVDASLELWVLAPSWRPDGGAAPWVWATKRLRHVAAAYLGQHAAEVNDLDLDLVDVPPSGDTGDVDTIDLLNRVAAAHPRAGVLAAALAAVASERDQRIFLETVQEAAGGNRRPAVTVATRWTMTPAAVRKVVERVRRRLCRLAFTDATYAAIAALPPLRLAA